MLLHAIDKKISIKELNQRIYQGQFILFQQQPDVKIFCRELRQLIRQSLSVSKPVTAHTSMSQDELLHRLHKLQMLVRKNASLGNIMNDTLKNIGFDMPDLYRDRLILRVVPPIPYGEEGREMHVKPHRDTWGTSINQQLNWWTPIYPIRSNRTIAFYPDYWEKPLANTTASWHFEDYLAARREAPPDRMADYPPTPAPIEQPKGKVFKPVIKPGDLLCFSAAHLHSSTPNTSKFTRFSIETRTVSLDEYNNSAGAVNVDNDEVGQMLGLFSNVVTGESLEDKVS